MTAPAPCLPERGALRGYSAQPERWAFSLQTMTTDQLIDFATFHAYRLAGYALTNLAEDAAILAFMFC